MSSFELRYSNVDMNMLLELSEELREAYKSYNPVIYYSPIHMSVEMDLEGREWLEVKAKVIEHILASFSLH